MSPEEIDQYIVRALSENRAQEEIAQELLAAGYSQDQIKVGFQNSELDQTTIVHEGTREVQSQKNEGSLWKILYSPLGAIAILSVLSVMGVLLLSANNNQNGRMSTTPLEINTQSPPELGIRTEPNITPEPQTDARITTAGNLVPVDSATASTANAESITKTLSQTRETVFQFKTGEKVILPTISGEETVMATLELRPTSSEDIYAASREINMSFDGNTGWFNNSANPEEMFSTEKLIKLVMPTILTKKVIDYLFSSKEFANYGERFIGTLTYFTDANNSLGQLYISAKYLSNTRELHVEMAAFSIAMMFDDEFLENTDSPEGYPSSVSIQILTVEPMLSARPQGYKRPSL
jgi:hypothetical protein